MINRKLIEMRQKLESEMAFIPRGDLYQNMLRQLYSVIRLNSLGSKAKYPNDKRIILNIAIKEAKKFAEENKVRFEPEYDREFFGV